MDNNTFLATVTCFFRKREIRSRYDYVAEYEEMGDMMVCESECEYGNFESSVIYNDYETFMDKVAHRILSM